MRRCLPFLFPFFTLLLPAGPAVAADPLLIAALPQAEQEEMRRQMREHWQQMPPEKRQALRERWQQMSPEERQTRKREMMERRQEARSQPPGAGANLPNAREDRQQIRQQIREQRGPMKQPAMPHGPRRH